MNIVLKNKNMLKNTVNVDIQMYMYFTINDA